MPKKLLIMLLNVDCSKPHRLGAPFFQAAAAAALDYEVSMVMTADAGLLMKKGYAERLRVKEGSPKTVYDFIKDAHRAGVKMYLCTPTLELHDLQPEDLIPECDDVMGGVAFIERVMDEDTRVLTY